MASTADRLANNLNFGALGKATELRQRLLFTLGALIVFRLGTFLPIPGINPLALQQFFEQQSSGILGIFDTFSGGALGRMGIFALGVMPYISASIIIQMMTHIYAPLISDVSSYVSSKETFEEAANIILNNINNDYSNKLTSKEIRSLLHKLKKDQSLPA